VLPLFSDCVEISFTIPQLFLMLKYSFFFLFQVSASLNSAVISGNCGKLHPHKWLSFSDIYYSCVDSSVVFQQQHMFSFLYILSASFEAFTAVMFQVEIFWGVMPCSVVVGYQRFRGPCCLHLQGVTTQKTSTLNSFSYCSPVKWLRSERPGFDSRLVHGFLSSSVHADMLRRPTNLLSSGYLRYFLGIKRPERLYYSSRINVVYIFLISWMRATYCAP
jgi:hypothetical protein